MWQTGNAPATRVSGAVAAVFVLIAGAALLTGCNSSSTSGSSSTTTAPTPPGRPSGLTAKQAGVTVRIRWHAPASGSGSTYRVYRGGRLMDQLTKTSFVDDTVTPGRTYTYQVATIRGMERSPRAIATVKVRKPPLAAARLVGLFNVSATPVRTTGLTGVGNATYAWEFRPRCKAGPCSSRWSWEGFRAVATRSGTTYTFSYSGNLNVRCGSNSATSNATAHIRVVSAAADHARWKVARITGTLDIETPAQLGCVATSEVDRIRGEFQA
ncbi:MAG: hypothetical protein ACTHNU_07000 [Gaiellales bacterium]